jgi:D-alanyl-D-alanine carboxypeptidase
MNERISEQLQSLLDQEVNRVNVPGLQLSVHTRDGRTWSGASGTVDLAQKIALEHNHILRVGSVTKMFTAVIIFKLIEEGKLSLDDTLSSYFPKVPNAESISLGQLLNHTSGLADVLEVPSVLSRSVIPWQNWKPETLVNLASKREPHFSPGGDWGYSNTNYILLGLIAEQVSGKPLAELYQSYITQPLGLSSTFFVPYEVAPAKLISGYERDLTPLPGIWMIRPKDKGWPTAAYASGAMVSTADDLVRFLESLFGGKLISPESLEHMTQFVEMSNPSFPEQTGSGLGIMRLTINEEEFWGHSGEFIGFTALVVHAANRSYSAAVIGNLSTFNAASVIQNLDLILRDSVEVPGS